MHSSAIPIAAVQHIPGNFISFFVSHYRSLPRKQIEVAQACFIII